MDHDSSAHAVVSGLHANGTDVLTSLEVNQERFSDEEQLAFAARDGRCLDSANRRDFSRLHKEWMASGRSHSGIIVRARQHLPAGYQILALRRICAALDEESARNAFVHLETWPSPLA